MDKFLNQFSAGRRLSVDFHCGGLCSSTVKMIGCKLLEGKGSGIFLQLGKEGFPGDNEGLFKGSFDFGNGERKRKGTRDRAGGRSCSRSRSGFLSSQLLVILV